MFVVVVVVDPLCRVPHDGARKRITCAAVTTPSYTPAKKDVDETKKKINDKNAIRVAPVRSSTITN